ncbi:hypothetical protein E3O06_06970 [Cryobacterium glaciale]|uniref:Uncharacterized protein n=1 Tax=Cryobacterium glaciale TaxID=1259145 RepID=A0A4R8V0T1_9MICO|nr:hypothetical protein [Cryobacterium glaciale]TFB74328.1 hypothetical protein E3O06_06970 [Cryobacterium glaciale]
MKSSKQETFRVIQSIQGIKSRLAIIVGLLVFDVVLLAVAAWRASILVPTFHIDGAFQTFSGLNRLASGEVPGLDFYPYLGIGPLYLLYPLFTLLGANLAASQFAASFMGLLVFSFCAGVASMLMLRSRSWLTAVLASSTALLLLFAAIEVVSRAQYPCIPCSMVIDYASTPGNSLRPIRALAPYALAALALGAYASNWRWWVKALSVGGAAGATIALWSNDYGLVSGTLLLVFLTIALLLSPRIKFAKRGLAVLWLTAALSYLSLGALATWGNFLQYLTFNFTDVRGDQFWYFGPWQPGSHVYGLSDFLVVLADPVVLFPLLVLMALFVRGVFTRRFDDWLLVYLGAALFLGGAAATIGGHIGGYFLAFLFWGIFVFSAAAIYDAERLLSRRLTVRRAARRHSLAIVAMAVIVVLGLGSGSALLFKGGRGTQTALAANPDFYFQNDLGGYLSKDYADHLEMKGASNSIVVEEYFGLYSALQHSTNGMPVDSVIGALGSQRLMFIDTMEQHPQRVITTSPIVSDWITWNLSANWWFYRELFRSYTVEESSPSTLLWSLSESADWTPASCAMDGSNAVRVSVDQPGLFEVHLEYRGPGNNARAFSMIRNNINVAGDAYGYVPLDPAAQEQRVPFYAEAPGVVQLDIRDEPNDGSTGLTEILSCSALRVDVPPESRAFELFADRLTPSASIQ